MFLRQASILRVVEELGLHPYIAHQGLTIEKWRAKLNDLNESWIEWSHNKGKCYSIFLFDNGRQIARWTTLQKAQTGIKNYLIDQTDPTIV